MSMETDETSAESDPPADSAELNMMTEEEQIAYAMRMSMQEGELERTDRGLNIFSLFSGENQNLLKMWEQYEEEWLDRDIRRFEKDIAHVYTLTEEERERIKRDQIERIKRRIERDQRAQRRPLSEAGPSKKEEGEAMDVDESKKEDYSEAMNDPAFLQVSSYHLVL